MSRSLLRCLSAIILVAATAAAAAPAIADQEAAPAPELLQKQNLVAWCIVPFDAKQRGPQERAEMLVRLGLTRVAYDWRPQHVPTFEEEIRQYQQHGLEYFAFWSWHDSMEPLIRKYGIRPQIWVMLSAPGADSQSEKVAEAAQQLLPLVQKTRSLGCSLGIYNHGGWTGEPANMVAVCDYLQKHQQADHVGIVYNFHHGHEHIDGFASHWQAMQPYILCLNINGMADSKTVAGGQNKILPIGSGQHEQQMLQTVIDSGYTGPVGILDHRNELDAEESLQQNLSGLQQLIPELQTGRQSGTSDQ